MVDNNKYQLDGKIEEIMPIEPLREKWEAFGWEVNEIRKGNDMKSVIEGLEKAKSMKGKGKPVVNLLGTEMGFGVDFMVGTHKWHGSPPNDEQLAKALGQLEETLGDY